MPADCCHENKTKDKVKTFILLSTQYVDKQTKQK